MKLAQFVLLFVLFASPIAVLCQTDMSSTGVPSDPYYTPVLPTSPYSENSTFVNSSITLCNYYSAAGTDNGATMCFRYNSNSTQICTENPLPFRSCWTTPASLVVSTFLSTEFIFIYTHVGGMMDETHVDRFYTEHGGFNYVFYTSSGWFINTESHYSFQSYIPHFYQPNVAYQFIQAIPEYVTKSYNIYVDDGDINNEQRIQPIDEESPPSIQNPAYWLTNIDRIMGTKTSYYWLSSNNKTEVELEGIIEHSTMDPILPCTVTWVLFYDYPDTNNVGAMVQAQTKIVTPTWWCG